MWRTSLLDLDRLKTPSSIKKTNYALELPLLNNYDRQADRAMYSQQILKIDDPSFLQPARVKTRSQRVVELLSVYLPPIDVSSNPLLFWNILLLLMIAYNFIQIPIVVLIINYAYSDPYYTIEFIYADIGILVYLLLDMLLIRWRICFYQKQCKNKQSVAIFYHYCQQYLVYDAIAFVGYLIFVCVREVAYIKLLFYFKFVSLASITNPIRYKIEFKLFAWSMYKFIRLMFFIYFVVSLGACIYFAIDYHYYLEQGFYFDNGLLWLTGSATTDAMNLVVTFPWQVWYEYAVYLLIQCIRGCGYGDMTARNPPEVLFNNLLMLFNLWMFSYFADGILNIVKKFKKETIKIQEEYAILNNFCEMHEVEEGTKKKSKVFIQSKRLKLNDEEQNKISQPLSQKLKIDFYLTFHRQFCDNLPILDTLFKHEDHSWTGFAKEMIMHLKTRYLYPGEVITEAKRHNDLIVALIVRGRVRVANAITQYEKKYTEWQYVGQTEFFLGGMTINRAVCNTHTKIYYYEQDLFFRVLARHPEEKEKFCYFHDAVKINRKEGRCFELNCCICQGPHMEEFCERNELFNSDALKRYLVTCERSDIQQRASYNRKLSLLSKTLRKPQISVDPSPEIQVDKYNRYRFYWPEYNQ